MTFYWENELLKEKIYNTFMISKAYGAKYLQKIFWTTSSNFLRYLDES